MKKWLAIILSIICAVNLLACSGEQTDSAFEQSGMIDEAEIEAIFAPLRREPQEETAKAKPDKSISQTFETQSAAETETKQESIEGVPVEYGHLFGNGYFDEKLVWTGYDEEYAEMIEELRSFFDERALGSVVVATDEDVLFAGGFHAKEIDGETWISPFTTYEIGELTQSFTAAAIMQQMQEGNLKGSDTLDKFFPEYPHGSQISVDNLLHMDSGIPDYIGESMKFFAGRSAEGYEAFMNGQMSDEEILSYFYKSELTFEPGEKSRFSNTNYYLLALILEQVTGITYEEYMQAYMFDVCGLEHTTCTETGNITGAPQGTGSNLAMGRCGRGAFDMHSNVCDILMWDRELMAGTLMDKEYLEYMTEAKNGYACGWSGTGMDTISQYGNTDAFLCANFIVQKEEGNIYLVMMIPESKAWGLPEQVMGIVGSYLE